MNCPLRSLCVATLVGVVLLLSTPAAAQPVVDIPRVEVITPAEPEPEPAANDGTYDQKLLRHTTCELLLIDDLGLRPLGAEESMDRLLHHAHVVVMDGPSYRTQRDKKRRPQSATESLEAKSETGSH